MLKGKNILITGGCGFLGSHLAERLCETNKVRILDSLAAGSLSNIQGFRKKVELIKADITEVDSILPHFKGIDIVYHLAADVNVQRSMENPTYTIRANVVGTNAVMEASYKAGVERAVFTSSAAVYGDGAIPVREDQPTNPLSVYGLTKLQGEEICRLYTKIFGLPTVVLRMMNLYGPRQRADSPYSGVIPLFARRIKAGEPVTIYGDGKQTRDFLNVLDAVEGLVLAGDKPVHDRTINLGTGKETSLNELVDTIARLSDKRPQIIRASARQGDILRSYSDISLAKKLLGFQPSVGIEDGLRELV